MKEAWLFILLYRIIKHNVLGLIQVYCDLKMCSLLLRISFRHYPWSNSYKTSVCPCLFHGAGRFGQIYTPKTNGTWRDRTYSQSSWRHVELPSGSQCARAKMKWNLLKRSEEKAELIHLDETAHLLTEFGKLSQTRSPDRVRDYSETVLFHFLMRDT